MLEKFKKQKVDDVTLARVKTKARAGLIRELDSNSGLANLLTTYYVQYGDWRKLFTSLDDREQSDRGRCAARGPASISFRKAALWR